MTPKQEEKAKGKPGRKPLWEGEETLAITAKLPRSLIARIEAWADGQGITRSLAIGKLLAAALDRETEETEGEGPPPE